MRKIVKSLLLRLTDKEFSQLQQLSEITGLKREPLIRQLIMGVQLRPRPPDTYKDLLRELSAIGNNVNQIAYWANARKGITNQEIQDTVALIQKVHSLVKENL